ncbi:MAG: DUF885 domain-containing protein [Thermoplasmata archaeon]
MTTAAEFDAVEKAVVDHLFEFQPSYAVGLGLHAYDGRVPDLSRAATDRWAAQADELLRRVGVFDPASLTEERRIDRLLLRLLLEAPLFGLRESMDLDRNPMGYVGLVSLTSYLVRDYASAPERVAAIVRTLEALPTMFEQGRARLRAPLPRPFVELALSMGEGIPAHFADAEVFAAAAGLGALVAKVRVPAEKALADFLRWLRDEMLPKATDDFALGAAKYQRLLFVREGIESPFADMRRAGEADLARNQARLAEIAKAQGVPPEELHLGIGLDHPPADQLLSTAHSFVEETRAFVESKALVTIPAGAECRVEETPAYGRATTTASMNPPGPFDTKTPVGIYYVTLVDTKWTPVQKEEWLRSLNRPVLRNVTVHEVYPGHYLQFLHLRATPGSLARKVYMSLSFVEGWAHYTEQLAVEAGLHGETASAEIAQLHDALLRNCRLLSSIGLHTASWSVERATQLFETAAHMDRLPAQREALRGTFDPEYFCYTLGKIAILDARRRVLAKKFHGELRAFHDAVLGSGCPPIGLLDRILEAEPSR